MNDYRRCGRETWDVPNGRFAPSPTGMLHVGNLRTALIAWLFARSSGARFLVRMEDLDPVTSSRALAQLQLRDLAEIGIDWDGDVVFQSERFALYDDAIARLAELGLVYECFCTRREILEASSAPNGAVPDGAYPGTCRSLTDGEREERRASGRSPALRLRTNGEVLRFTDRVCGEVEFAVDDVVLRRNDGMPAYNLAVVVDDEFQGVEEVVRADDLLSSTPRQILLGSLLGYRPLSYAHVPLVVGSTGVRLAKRDGAITLQELHQRNPACDAEYVRSLIGASLGLCEHNEPVTAAELLVRFDPNKVPRMPWTFEANGE